MKKVNDIYIIGVVLVLISSWMLLSVIIRPSFQETYQPLDDNTVEYLEKESYDSTVVELEELTAEEIEEQMYYQVEVTTLNNKWLEVNIEDLDVTELTESSYESFEDSMIKLSRQVNDILGYDLVVIDNNGDVVLYITDGYVADSIR
jgi:hypothetical protein